MLSFLFQFLISIGLPVLAFYLYETLANNGISTGTSPTNADSFDARGATPSHEDADTTAFGTQVQAELDQLQPLSVKREDVKEEMTAHVTDAPAEDAATSTKQKPAIILIAYASQSQNALALSHKLFSLLTAQLHTSASVRGTSNADTAEDSPQVVIMPEVRVMEMREEEEEEEGNAENDSNGVAVKKSVKKGGGKRLCGVDALLDDNAYALTILIASTYTDGTAPPRSQAFEAILKDAFEDHRVPRNTLAKKRFAIFGLGDIAYGEERFNTFAKNLHEWCRGLGAPAFVVPPVYASVEKTQSLFRVFSTALLKWVSRASFRADGTVTVAKKKPPTGAVRGNADASSVNNSSVATSRARESAAATAGITAMDGLNAETETCGCHCNSTNDDATGDGQTSSSCCMRRKSNGTAVAATNAEGQDGCASELDDDSDTSSQANNKAEEEDDGMDDVEDLVWDGTDDADFDIHKNPNELPELLYPKLRQNLEKQGYRLVGSHSGVKLCRWTKSMLRGRGGCYKHTFYDINSSQCMEMTPSLACANKCVFCWRHHTNPISRHFRWKQDPPELLIAQGMAGHYQMIKQMRGVPGVTPERLAIAMQIRHCALSLVGEPIMYPQINGFCDLLHQHHISSFMVTNAQFPEQLRDLKPVVQLYLSIDAPTPEELKRIDRPLFEDYWDRCLSCVKELAKKPQRTVFRLTLVNLYNTDNIRAYADLVAMGAPDFIEVKGVTYCGTSASSTLTMKQNVPRHDEVIGFCKALCEELASRSPNYQTPQMWSTAAEAKKCMSDGILPDEDTADVIVIPMEERNRPYHIACEHEHSCCVLIALDKFFFEGHWHTWINYNRFYELVESGRSDFTALDYAAETPTWATYKSKEKGFDPAQTRVTGRKARPTQATVVA